MTVRLGPLCALALWATCALAQEPLRTPPDRPVDVERIDLDVTIDLEGKQVEGAARIHVTALRDLRVLELDAVDHEISAVARLNPDDLARTELSYGYDQRTLSVDLELASGDDAWIEVLYRVRDPQDGLYFFGPTEDAPDTPLQCWTQGESISNRYWFPCVDHPDERQATSIVAHVPAGFTVISNGSLLAQEPEPETGLVRWHYDQARPHVAYLVSLIVGQFDEAHEEWRGRPLGYYVPVGRGEDIPRSFDRTRDMLDWFSERLDYEYPWPKYDQTVVEQFVAGGMENTGATTLVESTLHDARAHLDFSSEGLVAHELAHQWFGDLVTCRDWTHLWLNESFATYFTTLWFEHDRGSDRFDHELVSIMDRGLRSGVDRPIVDRRYPTPGSMFDGRAYPKGACVLHMLRMQLGEEAFWDGIQRYLREFQDRGVDTHDLRRSLERASGRNLERFVYDWLERPGHLHLDVRVQEDRAAGLVGVTLTQTQEGEAYHIPAHVALQFGEVEVERTLPMEQKELTVWIPASGPLTGFRFDPHEAVLLKHLTVHKPRGLWVRQLAQDPRVIGRIRAARALAGDRHAEAREALSLAAAEDPYWSVRREALTALGAHGASAREALLGGILDEHPEVRESAVVALRNLGRDPEVMAAMGLLLINGDPSYYVEAAAVTTFAGATEDLDELRELLTAQLEKDSHREVIRTAALSALADLDDPSLIPTLAELTGPSHDTSVRHTAARALAVAAVPDATEAQREQALDALRALLRTGHRRHQRAALDGLSALGAYAAPALEEIRAVAETAPQDRVRTHAERVATRIAEGQAPDRQLARLREQIEALRREGAELRGRLERVEARQPSGE